MLDDSDGEEDGGLIYGYLPTGAEVPSTIMVDGVGVGVVLVG